MSGKHTPGPWQARDDYTGQLTIIGNVDGEILHDGPSYSYTDVCEVADGLDALANARLIAAAPDLLAALVDLRRRFHSACLSTGTDAEYVLLSTPDADVAIARATVQP